VSKKKRKNYLSPPGIGIRRNKNMDDLDDLDETSSCTTCAKVLGYLGGLLLTYGVGLIVIFSFLHKQPGSNVLWWILTPLIYGTVLLFVIGIVFGAIAYCACVSIRILEYSYSCCKSLRRPKSRIYSPLDAELAVRQLPP
jgi:hypothetical protein